MRNLLEKIAKWFNKKPSIKDVVDEVNDKLQETKVNDSDNRKHKYVRSKGRCLKKDKKGAFGKATCACKKRKRK